MTSLAIVIYLAGAAAVGLRLLLNARCVILNDGQTHGPSDFAFIALIVIVGAILWPAVLMTWEPFGGRR